MGQRSPRLSAWARTTDMKPQASSRNPVTTSPSAAGMIGTRFIGAFCCAFAHAHCPRELSRTVIEGASADTARTSSIDACGVTCTVPRQVSRRVGTSTAQMDTCTSSLERDASLGGAARTHTRSHGQACGRARRQGRGLSDVQVPMVVPQRRNRVVVHRRHPQLRLVVLEDAVHLGRWGAEGWAGARVGESKREDAMGGGLAGPEPLCSARTLSGCCRERPFRSVPEPTLRRSFRTPSKFCFPPWPARWRS